MSDAGRPDAQQPRVLRTILASLLADGTLTVAKFAGAALSGSAAMLAEAFHSLADTTNQSLLLVGRALSVGGCRASLRLRQGAVFLAVRCFNRHPYHRRALFHPSGN
jgi:hypothetical protein